MTTPARQHSSISVALCTHNGEAFIEEQMRSILGQSYLPSQIVLSDDDSSDATVALATAVVEDFIAAHPDDNLEFVVLLNQPARGVARNFEQAIGACASDLVALCDQDDIWRSDRLFELEKKFGSRPELGLVHSNALLVNDTGDSLGTTLFESLGVTEWERKTEAEADAVRVLVRRNLVTGATTIFRRSIAEDALPIPAGWIHDEWFGIIAAAVGRIDIDTRTFTDYRQHDNNQIGATKLSFVGKLRKLREPRMERNRNLFLRARELVVRLEELGDRVEPSTLRIAREKQEHERFRTALPVNRFRRLAPVCAAAVLGDYSRYGMGSQDVLRDLVQPAA